MRCNSGALESAILSPIRPRRIPDKRPDPSGGGSKLAHCALSLRVLKVEPRTQFSRPVREGIGHAVLDMLNENLLRNAPIALECSFQQLLMYQLIYDRG